jgi:hypothetical protein
VKLACGLLALSLVACTAAAPVVETAPAKKTHKKTTTAVSDGSTSGSASVTDLGEVTPDQEIGFDVAEGTLGFNVVVTGNDSDWVGVSSLVSPSGAAVVANFNPDGSTIHVAIGSRGLGAFNVPQTDATTHGKVETGHWKLVVSGITPDPNAPTNKSSDALPVGATVTTPLHVMINSQKTSDGEFHGGAMDIHVYIPDGLELEGPSARHAITADDAPNDDAMTARVDAFYDKMKTLFDIDRGEVAFHSIDASFLSATDGPSRAALIQQATVDAPQALHIVFTNNMSYGGAADGGLLGYSVGLPGAANSAGTVRSAITVASYGGNTVATDATTMVHEMGHFIGLLHTTELDSYEPDLLADTPTCGNDCGVKNAPVPDGNNLMYPSDVTEDVIVSPSQVRVMQGSPIYRANAR